MLRDASICPVKRVDPIASGDPEGASMILAARAHIVAAKTERIGAVVGKTYSRAVARVDTIQTSPRRQPKNSGAILADVPHAAHGTERTRPCQLIMHESFGERIVPIQGVVATNPQRAGSVDEQRRDFDAAETGGVSWIILEDLEMVAIVPVE